MSQRGSKKEAGGVNEAKARVVRGKIRNETEFVAREYSAPLLRVNAPFFVKAPSLLPTHCYAASSTTTSHFPRHLLPRHTRVDACHAFRRCPANHCLHSNHRHPAVLYSPRSPATVLPTPPLRTSPDRQQGGMPGRRPQERLCRGRRTGAGQF